MANRVLVTFDVDGTLMQSTGLQANLLHKKAFSHAFLQVFGVEGTIDAIKHHGSTDPLVILNTLEHYGIPQETAAPKLPELKCKMVEYAMQHSSEVGEGLEVLPGVQELLEALSRRDDTVVGLVTGNLEDIAWLKMEGLGIRQYFSVPDFGGFGSDHSDRGEMVRIATTRAEQLYHGGFRLRAHVGDTPNDIRAAESGEPWPSVSAPGFSHKKICERPVTVKHLLSSWITLSMSEIFLKSLGCQAGSTSVQITC